MDDNALLQQLFLQSRQHLLDTHDGTRSAALIATIATNDAQDALTVFNELTSKPSDLGLR